MMCIDQTNVEERNHQVAMMKNIYQAAHQVLIDLGDGDSFSNTIVDLMPSLGVDRFSLQKFFSRRWFHRLWVLQEVGLANRATVHCGTRKCSWELLRHLVLQYRCYSIRKPPSRRIARESSTDLEAITPYRAARSPSPTVPRVLTNLPAAINLRSRLEGLWTWDEFINLLELTRHCSCDDPRDKIYGVLGLVKSESPPPFQVDYSLSYEEIYLQVALTSVEAGDISAILRNASGIAIRSYASDIFPSWAPHWCATGYDSRIRLESYSVGSCNILDLKVPHNRFRRPIVSAAYRVGTRFTRIGPPLSITNDSTAANDGLSSPSSPLMPTALKLRARLVGYVWNLSDDQYHGRAAKNSQQELLLRPTWLPPYVLRCNTCVSFSNKSLFEYQPIVPFLGTGVGTPWAFLSKEIWQSWRSSQEEIETCPQCHQPVLQQRRSQACDLDSVDSFAQIAKDMRFDPSIRSPRSVLICTESSLGFAPVGTLTGDSIWILEGQLVPFVLRNAKSFTVIHRGSEKPDSPDGMFRIVGPCYVHKPEIDFGKKLQWWKAKDEFETFGKPRIEHSEAWKLIQDPELLQATLDVTRRRRSWQYLDVW